MKKLTIFVMFFALFVSGCKTVRVDYLPKPIASDRVGRVIEQAIMEQPAKFRPEGVSIELDYIEIGGGTTTNSRSTGIGAPIGGIVVASGRERGQSKRLVTRLYYDSLGAIQLVKKRSLYIVTIRDKDRALLQRIYIRNQDRAFEFVDAIESLKTK
jgi:hypothetical protein